MSAITRVALGALLIGRPVTAVRLAGSPPSSRVLVVARLLGGRYAVQGALGLVVRHDKRIDAGVELLHAASMLPLARPGRPYARAALFSAAVASVLAATDLMQEGNTS